MEKSIEKEKMVARLNMLRGLFAILIVIGHCSMRFEKELLPFYIIHKFNMVGVCFFFYVSGFSLLYNLRTKENYLQHFLRNKMLSLFIIALLSQLVSRILAAGILHEKLNINVALLGTFNWYIYEMLIFYLVFYLTYRLKGMDIGGGWIILFIATFIIAVTTLYFFRYGSWTGWTAVYYFSSLSFPFGVAMCEYYETVFVRLEKHKVLYSIGLLFLAAACCVSLVLPQDSFWGGIVLRNLMGICIMSVVTLGVSAVDFKEVPLVGAVISFLTRYSTEIYLYQFCWLDIITKLYHREQQRIDIGYIAVVTGMTLLTALVFRPIDSRITRAVKK